MGNNTETSEFIQALRKDILKILGKSVIIGFVVIIILIVISDFYKSEHPKDWTNYQLEMTLITGQKITDVYKLPTYSVFIITTNRGSYSLEYQNSEHLQFGQAGKYAGVIRNGIIDYKVLKTWK